MKHSSNHPTAHPTPAPAPVSLHSTIREAVFRRRYVVLMLFIVSMLLHGRCSYAQAPQQFSFQGVARGADGKVLANKNIEVEFHIRQGSSIGNVVFGEVHSITTNESGIFTVPIGSKSNLGAVQWHTNSYFMQTLMIYDGLQNAVDLGTVQLLSVPYSLLSTNSAHSDISDISKLSEKWKDDTPIVQTGSFDQSADLPDVGSGTRLIWHPKKAAFRSGVNENGSWLDMNIGINSFATGQGTKASGTNSVAIGVDTHASGEQSFASGNQTTASGINSIALGIMASASGDNSAAMGFQTQAQADASFAIGAGVHAKTFGSIAVGVYNDVNDVPGINRIFQVGHGSGPASRSNALTIIKNGNVGIGNNVLNPQYILDIGARARIRHSSGGSTAGLYFDNSQNNPEGFVGMINDNEIGFYIGDAWRLVVSKTGTVYASQFFTTSDRRLKTDIRPFRNSLDNLSRLQGYTYHWKDPKSSRKLQTGLIAQEVEEYFPELVDTNKDGFKSVNYNGLIPHLIEVVKELDKKTEEIASLKKELASMQEMNKKLSALEASVKELLGAQGGNSTRVSK